MSRGGRRLLGIVLLVNLLGVGAPTRAAGPLSTNQFLIDLPAALRLAGARSLDIALAKQRLAEAKANRESAVWDFLPDLKPGVAYLRHDHLIQAVEGPIIEVQKENYAVGPTVVGKVDLGEAIYRNLAARQLVSAARFALESQRQDAILEAASGYFDLVKATAASGIAEEAVRISTDYARQVREASHAGIAFKADVLRVQVQTERYRAIARQAQEQQRIVAAQLAQNLHLDPAIDLAPTDRQPLEIEFLPKDRGLDALIAQALAKRPEFKENQSRLAAAHHAKNAAAIGPLIPTVGGQLFAGGFGGSSDAGPSRFGESEDYQATLGWRIGPGGLFDRGRIRAAEAQLEITRLSREKLLDEIKRQVVASRTRLDSLRDQLESYRAAIRAAEQTLNLTEQRKQFAVGAVLETIQAAEELTRARLDLATAIAEFDKSQYALSRAVGGL